MRQWFGWVAVGSIVVLTTGCGAGALPTNPSSALASSSRTATSLPIGTRTLETADSWLPWSFPEWQPGPGEPLGLSATIDSVVEANDVCVPNLRRVWDAQSSCKRFLVSVPSAGWLYGSLLWDASAPGFTLNSAGDVVLVRHDGRFASSDWQRTEVEVSARVEPGDYTVLVMIYVPVSLPFQLRMDLR
jgi:hypothetical protein